MMNILFNNQVIALRQNEVGDDVNIDCDIIKMFGTEFGLFIPTTTTGYYFIRWLRNGMQEILPKNSIQTTFLHVGNDGEVSLMTVNTGGNTIGSIPYHGNNFTLLGRSREISEAFTFMLKKITNIADAVKLVDDNNIVGLYQPQIYLVEDWVKYAEEKGYTKLWYRSTFDHSVEGYKDVTV